MRSEFRSVEYEQIKIKVNFMRMTDQVDRQFAQAESGIAKALRNGRARKHLQPGMAEQVQSQRATTVQGTREADEAAKKGQDTFSQSKPDELMSGGANTMSRGLGPELGQIVNGTALSEPLGLSINGFGQPQMATAERLENIQDPQQLMAMLQQTQARQQTLTQSRSSVGRQQSSQLNQNRGFSQQVKKFSELEKSFADKEKAYAMKDKMFQNIAKTMQTAGKALNTASVAIDGAAAGIEAAAAAAAAIPFVGGAIAVALRVVAKGLRVVAKGLKALSKTMASLGTKMTGMSRKMAGLTQKMKASKLANKAKSVASKAKLSKGMKTLKTIQSKLRQFDQQIKTNRQTMTKISARLQQLGVKTAPQGRLAQVGGLMQQGSRMMSMLGNNFGINGLGGWAAMTNTLGGVLNQGSAGSSPQILGTPTFHSRAV